MFSKINLRIQRAELTRDPNLVLKMDPYVIIRTSRAETRTSVAPSGGKQPVWNETFTLDVTGDNSIYVAIYDQETVGKDNAVAETFINLNQVQADGVPLSFPLAYKGQNAGFIYIDITAGGSNRNVPVAFTNNMAVNVHPTGPVNNQIPGATGAFIGTTPMGNGVVQTGAGMNLAMAAPGYVNRPLTTGEKIENFVEDTKQSARNMGNQISQGIDNMKQRASDAMNRSRDNYDSVTYTNQAVGYNGNVPVNMHMNASGNRSPVGSNRSVHTSRSPNYQANRPAVNIFGNTNNMPHPAPVTIIDNRLDRSRERLTNQSNAFTNVERNVNSAVNDMNRAANVAYTDAYNDVNRVANMVGNRSDRSRDHLPANNIPGANYNLPMAQPGYVTSQAQVNMMPVPQAQINMMATPQVNMMPAPQANMMPAAQVNMMPAAQVNMAPVAGQLVQPVNFNDPTYLSSPAYRNLTGKMIVKIVKAELTRDGNLIAKMDPYCMLRTKTLELRTYVAQKAGKNPVWNSAFDIELRGESSIYFGVWDRETFSADDIVADITFDLRGNMKNENFFVGWTPLYYKGNNAGRLFLELQYYPNAVGANLPVTPGPNGTYVNVNQDQFTQAY